ncbi:hypothetical protein IKG68_01350 [Candidatus Saccharibacteria bacterium]|nr:hypothetical protein [Candidatus Saccharibacteria bacterium]
MKKILMGIMTVVVAVASVVLGCAATVRAEGETATLSETQKNNIVQNCEAIHEKLVNVQHMDSRTRVYLGRYYETILTEYVMPLNMWLVANSMANAELIENQNSFTTMRSEFVSDYIAYQKELELLVGMDCTKDAERFYDKLVTVRKSRAVVEEDTVKMRKLMDTQVELVNKLKEGL